MNLIILIPTFLIISLVYSMVGLGGGSAYITAMVLAGISKETFPLIALGCNIIVSLLGFIRFRQAGFFCWRLFWPFAITSIPCAYIGGRLHVSDKVFTIVLAAALTVAAARMLFWKACSPNQKRIDPSPPLKLIIGIILGLVAGVTGIGGGIYLIPVLLFLGWATQKEAAAVASLFIFVNSASGILGQASKGAVNWSLFLPLAAIVLIGGLIGSKIGATRLRGETLQKIVGVIMLIAVCKLMGRLF